MIAAIKRFITGYTPETPLQREQRRNVQLHFELAAANKRASEAIEAASKLGAELYTIKRQRSEATAKGNTTKRLKREAAKVSV